MKPTGTGRRPILFVGEAPGELEDERGEQFVGKSGSLLRTTLERLGVDLDDCTKTNSFICRPPSNLAQDLYIESCRPNLLKAVRDHKPRVIVLLGGSAVKGLIPSERDDAVGSITKWVGWQIPSHEHQAWICPTYHPSYLLRMKDPVLDLLFRGHLRSAIKLEETPIPGEPLETLKKRVEIVTSERETRLKLKDLAKRKGILAFDYESTGIKPDHPKHRIVSCSFCLDGEGTWAGMITPDLHRYLSRVLKREKLLKVASNLKNEERWTIAKLGHPVASWFWDTMLASHVMDNRGQISGLKFQSFVRFGIADYDSAVEGFLKSTDGSGFNRIHEIPVRDLLLYNGLDSLLEFRLMVLQREAMRFK